MLFDSTVWQVQGSDNGDASLNMPLLNDDVQVFDAPPKVVHAPMAQSQGTSMQSMGSMEMDPLINMNTSLVRIIIPKLYT
jgi:hypothetical protein